MVFGENGVIFKFVIMVMGLLVVCWGDMLLLCKWVDMGIILLLVIIISFVDWISVLGGVGVGGGVVEVQMVFQIQFQLVLGVLEYIIEIDGQ